MFGVFQGRTFTFDRVFKPTTTQERVYIEAAQVIVQGKVSYVVGCVILPYFWFEMKLLWNHTFKTWGIFTVLKTRSTFWSDNLFCLVVKKCRSDIVIVKIFLSPPLSFSQHSKSVRQRFCLYHLGVLDFVCYSST